MADDIKAGAGDSAIPAHLTIMAFKDKEFQKCLGAFVALVNPESFDRTLNFSSETQKTKNKTGQKGEDSTATGESYRFELIFDATGVIDGMPTPEMGIQDMLAHFHDIVARNELPTNVKDADAELRKPNFLKLNYCGKNFLCVVSSMSIKYTLFSRNGAPLRARVSCDFKSVGHPALNDKDKSKDKKKTKTEKQPKKEVVVECNGDVEKVVCVCSENGYSTIHVND